METGASPSYVPSFLGSIKDQLADALFTIWFNSTAVDGSIDFGFIDDTKYTGDVAYTPLYNAGQVFYTMHWIGSAAGASAI